MFKEKYDSLNKSWAENCNRFSLPVNLIEIRTVQLPAGVTSLDFAFDHSIGNLLISEDYLEKGSLEELVSYLPHECMHYEQWKEGFSTQLLSSPPIVGINKFWLEYEERAAGEMGFALSQIIRNALLESDANRRLAGRKLLLDYLKLDVIPKIPQEVKSYVEIFYKSKKVTPKECLMTLNWFANLFADCLRLYAPCKTEEEKSAASAAIYKSWYFVKKPEIDYTLYLASKVEPKELEISRTIRCLFDEHWNIRKKLPYEELIATKSFEPAH
jgi:hypothetical protein